MKKRFSMSLVMGADEIGTMQGLANALHATAESFSHMSVGYSGTITDGDGNQLGTWEFGDVPPFVLGGK